MKRTLLSLTAAITSTGAASAAVTFHSDFDEASLGAITGLNVDTPNPDLGTTNSGTVTLNTGNQTLDLASNGITGFRDLRTTIPTSRWQHQAETTNFSTGSK